MRIWTIHPKYLDARGLVALWREALLARKVLLGETRGYRNHPQLLRFRSMPDPAASVGAYLTFVLDEALSRGYRFDALKTGGLRDFTPIPAARGQVLFEWEHLMAKLMTRDEKRYKELKAKGFPHVHPLFTLVEGGREIWEKTGGRN